MVVLYEIYSKLKTTPLTNKELVLNLIRFEYPHENYMYIHQKVLIFFSFIYLHFKNEFHCHTNSYCDDKYEFRF